MPSFFLYFKTCASSFLFVYSFLVYLFLLMPSLCFFILSPRLILPYSFIPSLYSLSFFLLMHSFFLYFKTCSSSFLFIPSVSLPTHPSASFRNKAALLLICYSLNHSLGIGQSRQLVCH